jgi:type I restriction enzyme S subunit
MTYQLYQKYKPSGFDWLGNIPKEWNTRRLKYLSYTRISNVDKKSEDETSVRLCNYIDVYKNEFIDMSFDFMVATATQDQIDSFQLSTGDVIITKDSETADDIGIPVFVRTTDTEKLVCGYHLALITPNHLILDGRFLFRLFQSDIYRSYFEVHSNGVTRFGLDTFSIINCDIVHPPLTEQQRIADFLDHETAKIDDVITKKQKLIKLLKEKRQATITHAVTKGLDPSAKLKPSGIEWLGNIPEGWEAKRLKFKIKTNPSKNENNNLSPDSEVSFIPMGAVSEDGSINLDDTKTLDEVIEGYTYFRDGDVVIAKITPCFENGKGTLMSGLNNGIGFGTTEFHVLRPTCIDAKYLYLLTTIHPFRKFGEANMKGAAGQKRVPEEFVKDFMLGFPSISEQRAIVDFLNRETEKIDKVICKIIAQIKMLQEYRQALITNAVTGKIKVS